MNWSLSGFILEWIAESSSKVMRYYKFFFLKGHLSQEYSYNLSCSKNLSYSFSGLFSFT